jgi:magnesium-transporting ATPase (P-type)
MRRNPLALAGSAFDALAAQWELPRTHRVVGTGLVVLFLIALATIELNRRGLLPDTLAAVVPLSHFAAVGLVFTFLLVFEVGSLVLALARSVADSLGKQFELLALILMRDAFLEFGRGGEPITWLRMGDAVPQALADMAGGLGVFILLDVYYRVQRHRAITMHERDQLSFVAAKKVVALVLISVFVVLAISTFWNALRGQVTPGFFPDFYTVLVLSDVLILLISLRYSASFPVVFRNAGFAAATVIVRVALSAPPYVNALLATGAVAFALVLSLAYNRFMGGLPLAIPAKTGVEDDH